MGGTVITLVALARLGNVSLEHKYITYIPICSFKFTSFLNGRYFGGEKTNKRVDALEARFGYSGISI